MRRASTYLLAGLAVFLLAISVLLRFYVLPGLLVTPLDQYAETFAPGTGTVFDPATLSERSNVDMIAHRTLRGDVAASTKDRGVWDESVVFSDSDGKLLTATTDRVAWDRKTGESVNCCKENVDGTPTKHVGLSYKFPFGAEKKTYQAFDTSVKRAYPMKYQGSDKVQGLTVYRYVQPIAPVQIGEVEVPGELVGSEEQSVKAPEFYSNTRTVWVEPVTGIIVKGSEELHQVLRDSAGADKVTLIDVHLIFAEKTQKQQGDLAKDGRSVVALVGTWVPLVCLLLGLIAGAFAIVLARRLEEPIEAAGQAPRRRAVHKG